MTNVIVYTNDNGNVSVCIPTGEISIDEVLAKDCPEHSVIMDISALPQGEDDFFDAWRLNDRTVNVDLAAAKIIQLGRINIAARAEAANRASNTAIGLPNTLSDADFAAMLASKRNAVGVSTTTAEIRAVRYDDIETQ